MKEVVSDGQPLVDDKIGNDNDANIGKTVGDHQRSQQQFGLLQ